MLLFSQLVIGTNVKICLRTKFDVLQDKFKMAPLQSPLMQKVNRSKQANRINDENH